MGDGWVELLVELLELDGLERVGEGLLVDEATALEGVAAAVAAAAPGVVKMTG